MGDRRWFGTDGIRGRVGSEPITPEFVLRLGWAAGQGLRPRSGSRILIGKDTRISGYMLESALEAGLSAAGVDVRFPGPMPTPGIAYLTRTFRCDAGLLISASHNPYYDNGIKFFSSNGDKLDDAIELAIEAQLEEMPWRPSTPRCSARLGALRTRRSLHRVLQEHGGPWVPAAMACEDRSGLRARRDLPRRARGVPRTRRRGHRDGRFAGWPQHQRRGWRDSAGGAGGARGRRARRSRNRLRRRW